MATDLMPSPAERLARLQRAWARGLTPPPRISVPEWADRYRRLAKEAGSTAGKWRTSQVEVARGPMLAVTEPGVHIITAMVATQLLKTELILNTVGYFAHLDPCPMLLLQPKEDAAEQFSKERVTPMIKATPVLRDLIGTGKTRSADETLLFKAFPGGFLALAGAGSPDNLARRPIRLLLADEVDKYPITREGNPLDLAGERMATFANWLSIRVCSPTIDDESLIAASYEAGDQRLASVACPECGHRSFLDFFTHVEWDKGEDGKTHRPETARVYCEGCGVGWSEGQRLRALQTLRWHQTRPFICCGDRQAPLDRYRDLWRAATDGDGRAAAVAMVWDWSQSDRHAVYRAKCGACGGWAVPNEHASFQAGKLYSPWPADTPARQARKWLDAGEDEDKRQVWWNTQAGKPYKRHQARALKPEGLAARAEVWAGEVPDGVAVITMGVDVQDYRVELEVTGWGRNEESWSLAYHVIDGEFPQPNVQAEIDSWIERQWRRADGRPFEVLATCIDTGGHHTEAVYQFCKARLGRRVFGIKGESARTGFRNPVWPTKRPTSRTKKTYRPVIIGVNAAKDFIRTALGRETPGPYYMHFPADRDINYYAQLTAERLVTKVISGRKYRVWELPDGRANEALDCRVYAYAALCACIHQGLKLNAQADRVGAAVTIAPMAGDAAAGAAGAGVDAQPSSAIAPAAEAPTIIRPVPPDAPPPQRKSLAAKLAS